MTASSKAGTRIERTCTCFAGDAQVDCAGRHHCPMSGPPDVARLLCSCPDRHGIVASVASYLAEAGANIVASDQYSTDPEDGMFFLRMEFHLDGLERSRDSLTTGFARVAEPF